jgi:transposase-like protein
LAHGRDLHIGQGVWKYLYRAVDKVGKTIDFLLTAKRDKKAAMRFFEKAMKTNGIPEKVTMDKSGANKSAIDQIVEDKDIVVEVRQIKYLNNRFCRSSVARSNKAMLRIENQNARL